MRPHTLVFAPILAVALLAGSTMGGQAQEPSCYLSRGTLEAAAERPSPLGETLITFGDQSGKVCYGSPGAKGRTVMGELVPFGEPWRLGANEATALHLPFPATVGGIQLEAGSYSLFAIPGETEWEFVLNGAVERGGIPIDDEIRASDVGSFTRPVTAADEMVERLTFRWDSHGADMGHLVISWEHTEVEIPIMKRGM